MIPTTFKSTVSPMIKLLNASQLFAQEEYFFPGSAEIAPQKLDENQPPWKCCQCGALTSQDFTECYSCDHTICQDCDESHPVN